MIFGPGLKEVGRLRPTLSGRRRSDSLHGSAKVRSSSSPEGGTKKKAGGKSVGVIRFSPAFLNGGLLNPGEFGRLGEAGASWRQDK